MNVEWRPIPGYEGIYLISSQGDIKTLARSVPMPRGRGVRWISESLLKPDINKDGYKCVALSKDGQQRRSTVHRLVAETFLEAPLIPDAEVCHNDGNRLNNAVSNLRWGSRSDNRYDSVAHGTHRQSRKTHCPQGHPYSPENTILKTNWNGRPGRTCRTCKRSRDRARAGRAA